MYAINIPKIYKIYVHHKHTKYLQSTCTPQVCQISTKYVYATNVPNIDKINKSVSIENPKYTRKIDAQEPIKLEKSC